MSLLLYKDGLLALKISGFKWEIFSQKKKQNKNKNKKWLGLGLYDFRASSSVRLYFLSILHGKTYFFYFTHPFLQNTHINLSILYIYSIKYSFFYNFLLFPPSLSLSLTDPQSVTTNDHSTPSHHHQGKPTQSQTHSIPNPLITHPIGSKIIKTHQWTRKAKLIKIKTHRPTPTINQNTREKKKTNRSERDQGLQPE